MSSSAARAAKSHVCSSGPGTVAASAYVKSLWRTTGAKRTRPRRRADASVRSADPAAGAAGGVAGGRATGGGDGGASKEDDAASAAPA